MSLTMIILMINNYDDDNSKRLSYQVRIPIMVYTDADTGVGVVKIRTLSKQVTMITIMMMTIQIDCRTR